MSKVGSLIMDCLCKDCAHDACLLWPADTSKYCTGLCQSCGENEGTLVPMADMQTEADAEFEKELGQLEEDAKGDDMVAHQAHERLRSMYAPDTSSLFDTIRGIVAAHDRKL
jgi:hypothetical protein